MTSSKETLISRREFIKLAGIGIITPFFPEMKLHCSFFNSGDKNSNKVAITVDDGWYPTVVEKMYKTCQKYSLSISAFPVGNAIKQSPDLWREIKKSGVEIYNHTQNHRNLGDLSSSEKRKELLEWEETYEKTFVETYKNKIVRPPFGNGIETELYQEAEKLNYIGICGWLAGSKGYSASYTPKEVWKDLKPRITSGAIILLHFVENDIDIIPWLADYLEENSLQATKLTELPGTPIYQKSRNKENNSPQKQNRFAPMF